ncbi:O-antigen/teichoic acid export membrane protein [Staphylococcus sp. AtDRG32]|uniref:lipopolysaccharide biosynthesis protein n=1 Tax=Staphylococcus TaxID=1279 RepID=UPI0010638FBB|nr:MULTISPECIES: oligosaccharide flippase family protein [Staphylococcus]MDO0979169.1 oligosaccharide flippase family protein [Staphylococcus hominis]MDO0996545.1 oligosaccharide flippase family protein [Staphylococcus hominis]TDW11163.1 O-antigen/teichoic acid export membrane protein [Staphylococcus sp. AtDRG32]
MKRLKNIGYTFIGNVAFSLVKWLTLILIVRLTNPEDVGGYTFAMAITAPITLFTNMRIRLRYVVEDNLTFKNIRVLRNILNIISLLTILFIGLVIFPTYLNYFVLVAFTKVLDLQSELYYAILHKKQNFKLISLMQIGKSIIIIVPFAIIVVITKNVNYGLLVQVISQFLWLVFVERKSIKYKDIESNETNKKLLFNIFLSGLPLGFVQMINSYNIMIPRYIIENFLSLKLVGVFASISYLLTIIDLFMNAISQNIIVRIKSYVNKKEFIKLSKYINKDIFLYSIILGFIVILPVIFLKDLLIGMIYGDFYKHYSNVLLIISFSIIFNFQSWMFDTVLMAFKAYKSQLIVSISTLVISIISSLVLIKYFGIIGASFAIVVITLSQALFKYILVTLNIKNEKKR